MVKEIETERERERVSERPTREEEGRGGGEGKGEKQTACPVEVLVFFCPNLRSDTPSLLPHCVH